MWVRDMGCPGWSREAHRCWGASPWFSSCLGVDADTHLGFLQVMTPLSYIFFFFLCFPRNPDGHADGDG